MRFIKWTIPALLFMASLAIPALADDFNPGSSAALSDSRITLSALHTILPEDTGPSLAAPPPERLAALQPADTEKPPLQARVIDTPEIETILQDYVDQHLELFPESTTLRIKNINFRRPFQLPDGILEVEVIPSHPVFLKNQRYNLVFRVNGRVEENITVQGKIEAMAPVVLANTDITKEMVIGPEDISLVSLDLATLRNPIFNPADVIGKVVRRPARKGTPLDGKNLELPVVIHRGDQVKIILLDGPLQITATGIAGHDAKQDTSIRVMNINSRKEIFCKVIAPGYVAVEL